MAKTPSAMVVDQDIQVRFEMKQIIKASGLTVGAESGYGIEAVTRAGETRPDVILVAVNEPMERPLQTVEQLLSVFPDTPVVIYSESREIESALRIGAGVAFEAARRSPVPASRRGRHGAARTGRAR